MACSGAKCESFERAAVGEPQRRGDTPGWQVLVPGDMDFLTTFFWISWWIILDFSVIFLDFSMKFFGFLGEPKSRGDTPGWQVHVPGKWIYWWHFLDFSMIFFGLLHKLSWISRWNFWIFLWTQEGGDDR